MAEPVSQTTRLARIRSLVGRLNDEAQGIDDGGIRGDAVTANLLKEAAAEIKRLKAKVVRIMKHAA